MLKWILNKLIARERQRQIFKHGYTHSHDMHELQFDPDHLWKEAQRHFNWGHYVIALALLKAYKDQMDAKQAPFV